MFERVLTGSAKGADDKYELIILRPSHFLTGGYPMVILHPTTKRPALFYTSKDGFLHKGRPTGPRLPSISSRGVAKRETPLNPIIVNFSADIRRRRLERELPEWRKGLDPVADHILQGVSELHDAVNWRPGLPIVPEPIPIGPPGKEKKRPGLPITKAERMLDLMEEGAFSHAH